MENKESSDKSTLLHFDTIKKKAAEDNSKYENHNSKNNNSVYHVHAEVVWEEDSIRYLVHKQDQRNGVD